MGTNDEICLRPRRACRGNPAVAGRSHSVGIDGIDVLHHRGEGKAADSTTSTTVNVSACRPSTETQVHAVDTPAGTASSTTTTTASNPLPRRKKPARAGTLRSRQAKPSSCVATDPPGLAALRPKSTAASAVVLLRRCAASGGEAASVRARSRVVAHQVAEMRSCPTRLEAHGIGTSHQVYRGRGCTRS